MIKCTKIGFSEFSPLCNNCYKIFLQHTHTPMCVCIFVCVCMHVCVGMYMCMYINLYMAIQTIFCNCICYSENKNK